MGLYDFTYYDLICRNAECFKSRPAWLEAETGQQLTFEEFKTHSDRLAVGLERLGVDRGDRIGVVGKNSLNYFLLYGAAAALGAVVLPINWRLSPEEMHFNLNDGAPKVLFADREFQPMLSGGDRSLPSVTSYFSLEGAADGFEDFDRLMANDGNIRPRDIAAEDGFVIIHTAAVAGRPRGALLSQTNLLCADLHLNYLFGLGPDDVHLNLLPIFHVGGLFMAAGSFQAGMLNVNVRKFDAIRSVELIDTHQVTVLFEFAPILSELLKAREAQGGSLRSLQTVAGLDGPETIEAYQTLTGGRFFSLYGQTETSCVATLGPYNARPGSAGRPVPLARVLVVDEADRPLAVGQTGEIVVKGPLVFKGYWNLESETAQTFRNGWHHTGDLGRFDAQGYLWYAGRKPEKELIKPGGENVYPAEVEQVILKHPDVLETVVFGVPDPKWKEGIKAVCLLKPGSRLEGRDLIRFVAERIASYKKPQYVQMVAELPHLADGSPDRAKVKALYGGEQR